MTTRILELIKTAAKVQLFSDSSNFFKIGELHYSKMLFIFAKKYKEQWPRQN
ncbi:hypothetical protein AGMMS50239_11750 [Bacteroidia bacterium]|nr:hypothetical protein AGMMS50239_11750 [Bacteroidia bacterium]